MYPVAPDWPEEKKKLINLRQALSRIHTITEEEEASKTRKIETGQPVRILETCSSTVYTKFRSARDN